METSGFFQYFRKRIKDRGFISIIIIYVSFCIFSAVYFGIKGQSRNFLLSLGFVLFAAAVFVVEHYFKLRMGELFVSAALFIAIGSILGSGYNFYTIFPFHDTLLHGMSGFIFAAFGASICERMLYNKEGKTPFYAILLFAFCFSLAVACIWEIFEFSCTMLFGFDMMEDTIVAEIRSYLLAGTHSETVNINGIIQTVIHYGDGSTYIIEGYLDIGLIDTLSDMIICFIGAVAFFVIAAVSYRKFPRINELLIPKIINSRDICEQYI